MLKPRRLITARLALRRKTRGRGLPACGSGVTVPASTKPNPSANISSTTRASLSNPAASPIGLLNCLPQSVVLRRAGSGSRERGASPSSMARVVQTMRRFGIEHPKHWPEKSVEIHGPTFRRFASHRQAKASLHARQIKRELPFSGMARPRRNVVATTIALALGVSSAAAGGTVETVLRSALAAACSDETAGIKRMAREIDEDAAGLHHQPIRDGKNIIGWSRSFLLRRLGIVEIARLAPGGCARQRSNQSPDIGWPARGAGVFAFGGWRLRNR